LLGYYKTEGNNYKSGISERQLMWVVDELTDGKAQDASTKEIFDIVTDLHRNLVRQNKLRLYKNGYFKTMINWLHKQFKEGSLCTNKLKSYTPYLSN
jgi:oligoribonuclease (3'-5' exoribonuclease)